MRLALIFISWGEAWFGLEPWFLLLLDKEVFLMSGYGVDPVLAAGTHSRIPPAHGEHHLECCTHTTWLSPYIPPVVDLSPKSLLSRSQGHSLIVQVFGLGYEPRQVGLQGRLWTPLPPCLSPGQPAHGWLRREFSGILLFWEMLGRLAKQHPSEVTGRGTVVFKTVLQLLKKKSLLQSYVVT